MIFYHACRKEPWGKAIEKNYLLHDRSTPSYPNVSPCTYLAITRENAFYSISKPDILLLIDYDPSTNPQQNNYAEDCWQLRVYEPIPLNKVIVLKENL